MATTQDVLEDPKVKAAIAALQSKSDKALDLLRKENAALKNSVEEFTRSVDSLDDDEAAAPKGISALKRKAEQVRVESEAARRRADAEKLAKYERATAIVDQYGEKFGIKVSELLDLPDALSMQQLVLEKMEAITVSESSAGRVGASGGDTLPSKPKSGKSDFHDDVKELLEEGHREGRTVFSTQKFD